MSKILFEPQLHVTGTGLFRVETGSEGTVIYSLASVDGLAPREGCVYGARDLMAEAAQAGRAILELHGKSVEVEVTANLAPVAAVMINSAPVFEALAFLTAATH